MPVNLAILSLGFGVVVARFCKVTARVCIGFSLVLLIVFGVLPVGQGMLYALESRVAAGDVPARVDGILILGGAIDTRESAAFQQAQVNDGADRIINALMLARAHPEAKIVFSGGSGLLERQVSGEADFMKTVISGLGFDSHKIIYETESRNTAENIHNSFDLVKPQAGENWILVTSAFHMPRSLGIARKTGWELIPHPVDYRSYGYYPILPREFDALDNLRAANLSIREFIGLLAYKMTGKI